MKRKWALHKTSHNSHNVHIIHKSWTTTLNLHISALQIAIYYIVSFRYYPRVNSQSLVQNKTRNKKIRQSETALVQKQNYSEAKHLVQEQNVFRSLTSNSKAKPLVQKQNYSEARLLVQKLNCSEAKHLVQEQNVFRS